MSNPGGGAALTRTELLGGRVICDQPATGFRVAIDAVLLAAAVPMRAGQRALDVGCGSGAAGLCLAARVPGALVRGLERQADLAALARGNAALSGLADRMGAHAGDLLAPPDEIAAVEFDHVFANPPYMKAGSGQVPADPAKALATIEGDAGLGDWLDFCVAKTRPGGTVTVVHRQDRLADILDHLGDAHGRVAVMPLLPKAGAAAKRVLVQVTKGRHGPILKVPGLILHEAGRKYTAAADAILRDAQPLILSETGDDNG